ncbi:MAG: hypothetical protein C0606_04710 [Hyphomicrobiales bacterium]|nr:MAG: hypothetical protein C0606_04710 [Hyphomicrobiales bacterium]
MSDGVILALIYVVSAAPLLFLPGWRALAVAAVVWLGASIWVVEFWQPAADLTFSQALFRALQLITGLAGSAAAIVARASVLLLKKRGVSVLAYGSAAAVLLLLPPVMALLFSK